jgi:hypothetical protein
VDGDKSFATYTKHYERSIIMDEEEFKIAIEILLPPEVDPKRHSWWVLYKVLCWGSNVGITNSEWETICKLRSATACKIGLHSWTYLYPTKPGKPAYECCYCGKTKGR